LLAGDVAARPAGSKNLTPKQLEAKLKKEASKSDKEAAIKKKKEEAEQKRKAKSVTKKVIQLSSKLSAPLAAALHKAMDVWNKAEAAGVGDNDAVQGFKKKMDQIEGYKKQTAAALSFYSKNPSCELQALPFDNDKGVFQLMRELAKDGQELKKDVIGPAAKAKK
jgi:hypothetical protein